MRVNVSAPRILLGRGNQCDVVIPDPEVSRQHLELVSSPEGWRFRDLTGNGVRVAGERCTEGQVRDGADIAIGRWSALFRHRPSSDSPGTTAAGSTALALRSTSDSPSREEHLPTQVRVRTAGQETIERLHKDAFTIGKSPTNDVVIDQPYISGQHLKLARHTDKFLVCDQSSSNGTWIGSVRIYEAEVPFYAALTLGETQVVLEPVAPPEQVQESYCGLIGSDPSMRALAEVIERVASSSAAISIFGESGTGKELVARAIHERSRQAQGPFVPVNCAAISKDLIESELFGHEKGAFTGAIATRRGAFEEANGGTLFLDEVGEFPIDLQAKMLRALELGEIKRVGSTRTISVNTRIVAATNRDLAARVRSGHFREDLYYRLCVVPLTIPPLRSRRDDILALVHHFIRVYAPSGQTVCVTAAAAECLKRYHWPGNVREVRNVVHRALLLRKGMHIDAEDLALPQAPNVFAASPELVPQRTDDLPTPTLEHHLKHAEREFIEATLDRLGNNRERVARALGISRSTLFKRLKDWGMTSDADDSDSTI